MLAGVLLIMLALGLAWLLREPLRVLLIIATALVSVQINYWKTVRQMRRAARRWSRGL